MLLPYDHAAQRDEQAAEEQDDEGCRLGNTHQHAVPHVAGVLAAEAAGVKAVDGASVERVHRGHIDSLQHVGAEVVHQLHLLDFRNGEHGERVVERRQRRVLVPDGDVGARLR